MKTEHLQLPTIVLGRKIIIVVDLELHGIRLQNPSDPTVRIHDGMTGGIILEKGALTTGDPQDFQVLGKDMGRDLLVRTAQSYIEAVKSRGALQSSPPVTRITRDLLTQPVVPAQTLDRDVQDFFEVAAAHLGQVTYSAESIAVATGHPIADIDAYLRAQAEAGVMQADESGFTLVGVTQPSVWRVPEGLRGQQQLGLESRLIRVMIGGPSDTEDEVKAARRVLEQWNLRNAEELRTVLLFKHWQSHAYPGWGERPQALINEQLVEKADLLIAVFWTRLGMHTGVEESGTVEEIRTMAAAGRPVHLYFSSRQVDAQVMDDQRAIDEFRRVAAFRREVETQRLGMYGTFGSTETFSEVLDQHLTARVRDLRDRDFQVSQSTQGSVRAFRDKQRAEISTLRQTVTQLEIEFGSNLQRIEGGLTKAQHTLGRLAEGITAHYARWKPMLHDDARQAWDGLIARAKQEASMPITYGRQDSLEAVGGYLFRATSKWLDTLEEGLQQL